MLRPSLARGVLPLVLAIACTPAAPPLEGTPVPARLPAIELPPGHRRMVIAWEARDPDVTLRGDGLVRVAPPDSARLDLFLSGGWGGGRAYLIGDQITIPDVPMIRRYLPPPPLMWAAFGRLAVPPAADTTARVDGDTLRADIGRDPRWRVTLAAGRLVRLERIENDRRREWVARYPSGRVEYRDEATGRSLTITITRAEDALPFDQATWAR